MPSSPKKASRRRGRGILELIFLHEQFSRRLRHVDTCALPGRLSDRIRRTPAIIDRRIKLARTKSLSRQIRLARATRGMSVAQVAENVGVTPVSIYYWESGRVRPRDRNLSQLCKVLRLPVRETMALTGR